MQLPINTIKIPRIQARQIIIEEELYELMQSMREHGLLVPIIVRKEQDEYVLVAGLRRLMAANKLGWQQIECKVVTTSPSEAHTLSWIENFIRSEPNPVDLGEYFLDLQKEFGLTFKQIGDMIGKTDAFVSQHAQLARSPSLLKEMVRAGKISFAVARYLMRIEEALAEKG